MPVQDISNEGETADPSDIVEINVGGEAIIQCHRRTLCLASDSMFSHMFSGRWDDSCARDSQGRIFLDHDPELIRFIVNYLRIKRIEDPSNPVPPPKIPKDKRAEFHCLLRYFGLYSFFYPTFLMDCSNVEVVQPQGSNVTTTRTNDRELQLTYNANGHYFVACKPALVDAWSPRNCWWKLTIDVLPRRWIYLGIISNLKATNNSPTDATSYGWAGKNQIYHQGSVSTSSSEAGWIGFVRGECLHFYFSNNKLAMFSVTKNRLFTINDVQPLDIYIHINFYDATTRVTLASLSDDERATLSDKLGILAYE